MAMIAKIYQVKSGTWTVHCASCDPAWHARKLPTREAAVEKREEHRAVHADVDQGMPPRIGWLRGTSWDAATPRQVSRSSTPSRGLYRTRGNKRT